MSRVKGGFDLISLPLYRYPYLDTTGLFNPPLPLTRKNDQTLGAEELTDNIFGGEVPAIPTAFSG